MFQSKQKIPAPIPPKLYRSTCRLLSMDLPKSCLLLLLFIASTLVAAGNHHHDDHTGFGVEKMFVFGDSYADTGNVQKSFGNSWKTPYGATFPGKPAGRWSDGRVLTDFVAKFFGIKTPVAYRWMKYFKNKLQFGINFAYGGTGVFNTLSPEPNMTTQIDFFQKLLKDNVYTKYDLNSALFLVTLSGNDYSYYLTTGGTTEGLPTFIGTVVKQLGVNLRRLHALGARKIAVTGLQPLGCLPGSTIRTSYQQCNATQNTAVAYHNLLLDQAVAGLNNQSGYAAFTVLDLFTTFTTVLQTKKDETGTLRFDSPLKPCCMGISPQYNCASVDEKGNKMYTVCSNADTAFFWDGAHPTQAGWRAVSAALKPVLHQIFSN